MLLAYGGPAPGPAGPALARLVRGAGGRRAVRPPPRRGQRRAAPVPRRLPRGGARAWPSTGSTTSPTGSRPEGAPRRYDTRFFVAGAPPGQDAAHDAGETIAAAWLRPADALGRFRAGEIELIFPTIRTLQAIGRFATGGELVAAAAAAGRAPLDPPPRWSSTAAPCGSSSGPGRPRLRGRRPAGRRAR